MMQQAQYLAQSQAQQYSQQAVTANNEEYLFQTRLAQITTEFPIFNENSPQYDQQLSNMALTIGKGLIADGVPKVQILDRVMEVMQPMLVMRQAPQQSQPVPQAQRSLQANVQAAASQPPATHRAGSTPQRSNIDVNSMTIEDFEKLTDKEIEQLYGNH
jgi:hypothetical protein